MLEITDSIPTVTLYPKRIKIVAMFFLFVGFVAVGIWLGLSGKQMGYWCAGFFALGIPIALIQLIPGSSYLYIDQTGVTCCSLFRKFTTPWSAVEHFCVVSMTQTGLKVHTMVGFDYVAEYDRSRLGRKVSKVVGKCESALPDTYGMKAEELADFLNQCLEIARLNEEEQISPDNIQATEPEEFYYSDHEDI